MTRADTQHSQHTQAAVIGAETTAVPQAISSGTVLGDEVIENLIEL